MQRKELNGKPILREETGHQEESFERRGEGQYDENINSDNLQNKNVDPAETEGERSVKNDDEGLRGG